MGVPKRLAFENAGENFAAIRFLALRHDRALAGAAAIEFELDIASAKARCAADNRR